MSRMFCFVASKFAPLRFRIQVRLLVTSLVANGKHCRLFCLHIAHLSKIDHLEHRGYVVFRILGVRLEGSYHHCETVSFVCKSRDDPSCSFLPFSLCKSPWVILRGGCWRIISKAPSGGPIGCSGGQAMAMHILITCKSAGCELLSPFFSCYRDFVPTYGT